MTATGHAVIGTLIAAKIANPLLAIPLALVSHIAADAFPHWDTATNRLEKGKKRVLIDTVFDVGFSFYVSYLLITLLFPQTPLSYAFLMVIAAQALDWLMAPYYFFAINIPPFTWAYNFQKLFDHPLKQPWGVINQVAVLLLLIFLAKVI